MKVFLTRAAQNELDEIKTERPKDYEGIVADIKSLQKGPFPVSPKSKKIRGKNGAFWRLRSSDYRLLYRQIDKTSLIVLRIILKKHLERILKHL